MEDEDRVRRVTTTILSFQLILLSRTDKKLLKIGDDWGLRPHPAMPEYRNR